MAADASSDGGLPEDTKASEIIAQPLSQALNVFAKHTGLQLIYLSHLTVNRRSGQVPAGLSPVAALTRLLEDTGLDFTFLNDRTIEIFARSGGNGHAAKSTPPTESLASNALAEVVVTATKREEPLSLVPMSITVLSAQEMQLQDVRTISDIAERTPGLMFDLNTQFGTAIITNIVIRGISTSRGAPTTGIYIGDVPIISDMPIEASINVFRNPSPVTFDLDRVEVLRGPQSTLFGSNTPAGAVRFIPNEANATQFSQSYHSEVQISQNAAMSSELGAAVGGPIIEDRIGARISAWYRADGGYIDRVDPINGSNIDRDANRSLSKAGRLGLVIQPTESLRILPSVDYQSVYRHDTSTFYTSLSDPGDAILRNGKLLRQPLQDTFTLTSLKFDESLGRVDLTGITGYFDRTSEAIIDQTNAACIVYFGTCGNPLGPAYPSSYTQAIPTVLTQHQFTFTQELRLAYSDPTARVTWLAGAFYSKRHRAVLRDTYEISQPSNPGIYSLTSYSGTEIAVFGQLRLALSRWHLDVGTRGSWSRGDYTSFQDGFSNSNPLGFTRAVGKFEPLPDQPRFALSFQPDADDFLYAEVAKGARGSGGANSPALCNGIAVPTTYPSDAIWNYEVGAKNLLFDHRLQLAASLFFIRWDGIQEDIVDECGNAYTAAAGVGSSKGFDLTAQALLSEHLRLNLALGFTDARYERTVLTAGGKVVVNRGTVIGPVPSVPSPWSGTLSLDYQRPLTANVVGYLGADDIFTTRNPGPFTQNDPNALSYSPGFRSNPSTNRLNLRLGVIRSSLNVKLSLENALNSSPTLHADSDATGSSLYYAYTFRPRTVGLTIDWKQ